MTSTTNYGLRASDQVTLTARENGSPTPGAQLTVKYIPNDAIIVPGISGKIFEF
jgi:hypothetical protein